LAAFCTAFRTPTSITTEQQHRAARRVHSELAEAMQYHRCSTPAVPVQYLSSTSPVKNQSQDRCLVQLPCTYLHARHGSNALTPHTGQSHRASRRPDPTRRKVHAKGGCTVQQQRVWHPAQLT
jgi:hypothetical protein